jgi:8-oxo-dGTP pyrophosphatase MutT (NUDIX family)
MNSLPSPPIPSATVVVLRDADLGPEVLLLLRNNELKFAPGAWVFPGGRIDPEDYYSDCAADTGEAIQAAARRAASREAQEEAGIFIDPGKIKLINHYITPLSSPRRFSTWFYLADGNHCERIKIDGGEIVDYRWATAANALAEYHADRLLLIRPTRETLESLQAVTSVAMALQVARSPG